MADLTIKQNDTWPKLEATLSDANGPVDLTAATSVKFIMRKVGGTPIVTGTGAKKSPPGVDGVVTYTWIAADTSVVGSYEGEFELTFPGGVETFPNEGYFTIEIVDDLG